MNERAASDRRLSLQLATHRTLQLSAAQIEAELNADAHELRGLTTDDERLITEHLRHHAASASSPPPSPPPPPRRAPPPHADSWRAYFAALFDRRLANAAPGDGACDSAESARRFYVDALGDGGLEPRRDESEEDATLTSREAIVFGVVDGESATAAASGTSADALVERRDHHRDLRHVTDEWYVCSLRARCDSQAFDFFWCFFELLFINVM